MAGICKAAFCESSNVKRAHESEPPPPLSLHQISSHWTVTFADRSLDLICHLILNPSKLEICVQDKWSCDHLHMLLLYTCIKHTRITQTISFSARLQRLPSPAASCSAHTRVCCSVDHDSSFLPEVRTAMQLQQKKKNNSHKSSSLAVLFFYFLL